MTLKEEVILMTTMGDETDIRQIPESDPGISVSSWNPLSYYRPSLNSL